MEPKIIAIGGSAGSLAVIVEIVVSLPQVLNASIFVVIHSPPREKSDVPEILNFRHRLPAQQAEEGTRIEVGKIYVAPPDRHLILAEGHIHLSRGPKEGLVRPSINVTFRSAATTYGERVIGVLLSGMLDDGAAGIWEIANRGGTTIVQDPDDAKYNSMPLNALRDAPVDYRLQGREIGPMLSSLANAAATPAKRPLVSEQGARVFSGYTCPECCGPLHESRKAVPSEFRCRVGHVTPLRTLTSEETSTLERKMYEARLALDGGAGFADYAAARMEDVDIEVLRREADQLQNQAETIRKMIEDRLMPSVS